MIQYEFYLLGYHAETTVHFQQTTWHYMLKIYLMITTAVRTSNSTIFRMVNIILRSVRKNKKHSEWKVAKKTFENSVLWYGSHLSSLVCLA
jgi:hypothetical protein